MVSASFAPAPAPPLLRLAVLTCACRWKPFDRARFWPDLGPRFADAERMGRAAVAGKNASFPVGIVQDDKRDLDWATVLKRTFEAYIRGERPNMYGEWIQW